MEDQDASQEGLSLKQRLLRGVGLPLWVIAAFYGANFLTSFVLGALYEAGLLSMDTASPLFVSIVAAIVYVLAMVIAIGVPFKARGSRTTKEELGLTRFPNWIDIALAPACLITYSVIAGILLVIVQGVVPGFDAEETQEIGFENLIHLYEYLFAFITLVIMAPVAEEVLMRGYLYGKLRKVMPAIGAVLISAVLFSLLHLGISEDPESGRLVFTQWNVVLNILPLGIILAILREKTGSIWAGIFLHMVKNGLAYYLLFINPDFLTTIGR